MEIQRGHKWLSKKHFQQHDQKKKCPNNETSTVHQPQNKGFSSAHLETSARHKLPLWDPNSNKQPNDARLIFPKVASCCGSAVCCWFRWSDGWGDGLIAAWMTERGASGGDCRAFHTETSHAAAPCDSRWQKNSVSDGQQSVCNMCIKQLFGRRTR